MYINSNQIDDYKTPIFIGITGHRDIVEEEHIISLITKIIYEVKLKYAESPIILLTPLAEGADRAAAKAINKIRNESIKYSLILPMDEKEYLTTFTSEESIQEYDQLKKKAIGCLQVPLLNPDIVQGTESKEEKQAKLFANMGAYIVLHTQILIAVWNGAEELERKECLFRRVNQLGIGCAASSGRCSYYNFKHGGTYHILRMRFFGIEDEYKGESSYLAKREFGPVYWIKAQRKSSDYVVGGEEMIGPIFPEYPIDYSKNDYSVIASNGMCRNRVIDRFVKEEKRSNKARRPVYEEILDRLNHYNDDISKNFKRYQHQQNDKKGYDCEINRVVNCYLISDALSLHYQKKRYRQSVFLIGIALLAMLSFNLYSGPINNIGFLVSYTFLYLYGTGFYLLRVKKARYHEKYLEYRGISEALRVQVFWSMGGLDKKVSEYYLTNQKSINEWIKVAIKNVSMIYDVTRNPSQKKLLLSRGFDDVYKLWLQDQRDYFVKKAPVKEKRHNNSKLLSKIIYLTAFVITVFILVNYIVLMFSDSVTNKELTDILHRWGTFLIGFMPVIVAMITVYSELMAYEKLSTNYSWMRMVYSLAVHEYERIKMNYSNEEKIMKEKMKKLFFEVGIEALNENGEWVGLFKERTPEMPK